jgi:RNA polymerase sigma-70 factor (ECF subfamily)
VIAATTQPASPTDIELVERCLEKDDRAWEQIVSRYRKRVLHLAYKFTGRYEEAEDLMQEVFLRVFRGLDRFDREASFVTWLMSVARNHCIDHYRSKVRAREVLLDDVMDLQAMAAPTGNPHRMIEEQDRRQLLRDALERLPERLQSAIILRDLMELSYDEIVARLGRPEGTVKSRLNRGRAALARELMRSQRGVRQPAPNRPRQEAAHRRRHGGA